MYLCFILGFAAHRVWAAWTYHKEKMPRWLRFNRVDKTKIRYFDGLVPQYVDVSSGKVLFRGHELD